MADPRNKYLAAQEQQERMEKQHAAQAEFMRKTLVHLSAAAKGLDEGLDRELALLREKMQGASGVQVVEQMERVQHAVVAFERSRDLQNEQAASRFATLVDQLLQLKIPTEARKKLESYKSAIKGRLDSWRIYPSLVAELAAIQELALKAASEPEQGFWQRLKGGTRLKSSDAEEKERAQASEVASKAHESKNEKAETVKINVETPEAEDSYPQVARRITRTLSNLVESIEANELIKHKVEIVQARLHRGLDWFALAVTLEDIRDILMQRYLAADKEFSDYLKKINEDLNSIRGKLGLAVEEDAKQAGAVKALSHAVSTHVNNMRKSLDNSENLNHLKEEVKIHIDDIQRALENYRNNENENTSLTEQLKTLVSRIQTIESESEEARVLLEEERYKATHDPLTSLPNREAYGERAWQEFQRFKRYQRPLTLAVCDVDHFKKINDKFGHQAGDKVLKLFAKLLSTRLREVDFVGRYGGEEFVILLPETSSDQALVVLDKLRKHVGSTPFRFRDEPVQITASFGIATFREEDQVETVFARADKALYEAKNKGRNCCCIADK